MAVTDLSVLQTVIAELAQKEYTDFLRDLVRQPSFFGNEHAAQTLVRERMQRVASHVHESLSRPGDSQSVNLACRIPGACGGRSLVLNAHCDVAPVDGEWRHPPFAAEVENGVLYGRGAQDDKAGIATILLVAESLARAGIRLKGDLILHSVVEDETTGNGTRALIEAGFGGDGAIICDGTWTERIVHAHLGQIWLDITVTGQPVAACVASRGINPIDIAMQWVGAIRQWATTRNDHAAPFGTIEHPFFINLGALHAGVWHGSVPAEANLKVQIGFGPELSPGEVLAEAQTIATGISDRIQVKQGQLATPAVWSAPDNELIQKLRSIVEERSAQTVNVVAVTGHCDMRHLGTDHVCLYGPGAGWNAHAIDEGYRLADMAVVAGHLAAFAMAWCGVAGE